MPSDENPRPGPQYLNGLSSGPQKNLGPRSEQRPSQPKQQDLFLPRPVDMFAMRHKLVTLARHLSGGFKGERSSLSQSLPGLPAISGRLEAGLFNDAYAGRIRPVRIAAVFR